MDAGKITVYGTTWCGDCVRARRFLDERLIPYEWVDIVKNAEAQDFVARVNNGHRSVPTIVFEDGSVLVEPSDAELEARMGASS
jgi:mycoredoxin